MQEIKEILEKRLELLKQEIEKSMANHNALIGRLNECMDNIKAIEDKIKENFADPSVISDAVISQE